MHRSAASEESSIPKLELGNEMRGCGVWEKSLCSKLLLGTPTGFEALLQKRGDDHAPKRSFGRKQHSQAGAWERDAG